MAPVHRDDEIAAAAAGFCFYNALPAAAPVAARLYHCDSHDPKHRVPTPPRSLMIIFPVLAPIACCHEDMPTAGEEEPGGVEDSVDSTRRGGWERRPGDCSSDVHGDDEDAVGDVGDGKVPEDRADIASCCCCFEQSQPRRQRGRRCALPVQSPQFPALGRRCNLQLADRDVVLAVAATVERADAVGIAFAADLLRRGEMAAIANDNAAAAAYRRRCIAAGRADNNSASSHRDDEEAMMLIVAAAVVAVAVVAVPYNSTEPSSPVDCHYCCDRSPLPLRVTIRIPCC